MKRRYILSPEAGMDLLKIWRYIRNEASRDMANHVESAILEKIFIWQETPGAATGGRI